ncbi:MAG: CbtB domain-containing protein [Pseudomonadota bacterium]
MPSLPNVIDPAIVPVSDINARPASTVWRDKILPSLMAGALGLVLLYGAAFSGMEALHNAAHDGRHSAGFPCH